MLDSHILELQIRKNKIDSKKLGGIIIIFKLGGIKNSSGGEF